MKPVLSSLAAIAIFLSAAGICLADQQTPAAAAAPAATAKPAAMTDDAKKAKAKECSTQADAKGLHGTARKEFRSKCKHS